MHRYARGSGAYAPICTILHDRVQIQCISLYYVQILEIIKLIEAIRVSKLLIWNISSLFTITETCFIFSRQVSERLWSILLIFGQYFHDLHQNMHQNARCRTEYAPNLKTDMHRICTMVHIGA